MTTDASNLSKEVHAQLDREIGALSNRLAQIDEQLLPQLQDAVEQAERKSQESGLDTDYAKAERLQEQLIKLIDEGTNTSRHLQILRSPRELERRTNTALTLKTSIRRSTDMSTTEETTTPAVPAVPAKPKKPNAQDKGAPAIYLNDDGKFRIGMDARLKSDLVLSATGQITAEKPGASLQVFEPEEAEQLIEAFDWGYFLDRKKALIAVEADKKAKSAAEREEKARQRAEEKAAKDAAKAAAKAEADLAKQSQVNEAESKKAAAAAPSKTDQARAQREAKAAAAAATGK
jgi:hypothetical protein